MLKKQLVEGDKVEEMLKFQTWALNLKSMF